MSQQDRDFQAVFFDFDGVLADSEPVHFECWRDVLRPRGLHLTWEYYERECIGVSDRAMLETLARLANPPQSLDELWPLYPMKKQLFRERALTNPPIAEETIQAVKGVVGLPLAVVTSSGVAEIEPILQKVGLLTAMATVVYGNDVKHLKPSPEPYLLAAERLGVRRALVFEDSAAGIESGTAAGHRVVRVSHAGEVPRLIRENIA